MRHVRNPQMELGEIGIEDIWINLKSRDDIPALLLGLQHLYADGRVGGGIAAPRPSQTRAGAIDALGSSPDRFAQVNVARRGLDVAVPEQLPDHRKGLAERQRAGSEAVSDVMDSRPFAPRRRRSGSAGTLSPASPRSR